MGQSLGGNILDKMRDSLEEIDFESKNKGEIKKTINDWDNDRIIKECLSQSGYTRNSIENLTIREQLLQLFANITHLKIRKEKHHHKSTLYKKRSEIYRKKLEDEGYDTDQIVEDRVREMNIDEAIAQELKEMSVTLAYEK